MKKLSLIVITGMLLYSCSNEVDLINNEIPNLEIEVEEVSNNVTLDDIQTYMEKGSAIASRNGGNGEIEVITYQNDTVMYLLNYGNGWEMMPSDKRFPLRVAYSEEGTLDYTSISEAQQTWFNGMAEEIRLMKKYGKDYDNIYNKVWSRFSPKKKLIHSRSGIEGEDNWILHNVKEESTIKANKNHLISTAWNQTYNKYCPPKSTGDGNCPTGCGAAAAAQVLYYFHNQWGVPSHMITTPNYDPLKKIYSFSGWDTKPWDDMNYENISLLQGHIGEKSDMKYSDESSSCELEDKLEKALKVYSIDSDYEETWNSAIIINNLNSNIPIIGGLLTKDGKGHLIIIDGYREIFTEYEEIYIYVEDLDSYPGDIYDHDESGDPVPEEGPTRIISYNTTDLYYQFNWGDGHINNIYYLAGMSPTFDFGGKTGIITFDGNKRMLCNFRIKL